MKRIIFFVLLVKVIYCQINITINNYQIDKNDTVDVEIITTKLPEDSIYSYNLKVEYNENILEGIEYLIDGTISKKYSIAENYSKSGEIIVSAIGTTPLEGSGVLGKLRFVALEDGISNIIFKRFIFNNGNPEIELKNGRVLVGDINLIHYKQKQPDKYSLTNYPNPFNPTTKISFALPKGSQVVLKIYDLNGTMVEKVDYGTMNAGRYHYNFNASQYSSGIFLYKLEADNFIDIKKMTLIK